MSGRFRIGLLGKQSRADFCSGSEALDHYFHRQVSQDIRRHITTCFVAVDADTQALAGYYTLSATSIALDALPEGQAKRLPSYPHVPAALLGRLAVSEAYQGQGLGGVLLIDALKRTLDVELGVYALLVEAKDDAAQAFYERYGFIALPGHGVRRLMIPMATAKKEIL